jgi:hypothetical protein
MQSYMSWKATEGHSGGLACYWELGTTIFEVGSINNSISCLAPLFSI